MIEEAGRSVALRQGHWKYIRRRSKRAAEGNASGELYNLDTDVAEQNNVAEGNMARAKKMRELLQLTIDTKNGIRAISKKKQ